MGFKYEIIVQEAVVTFYGDLIENGGRVIQRERELPLPNVNTSVNTVSVEN